MTTMEKVKQRQQHKVSGWSRGTKEEDLGMSFPSPPAVAKAGPSNPRRVATTGIKPPAPHAKHSGFHDDTARLMDLTTDSDDPIDGLSRKTNENRRVTTPPPKPRPQQHSTSHLYPRSSPTGKKASRRSPSVQVMDDRRPTVKPANKAKPTAKAVADPRNTTKDAYVRQRSPSSSSLAAPSAPRKQTGSLGKAVAPAAPFPMASAGRRQAQAPSSQNSPIVISGDEESDASDQEMVVAQDFPVALTPQKKKTRKRRSTCLPKSDEDDSDGPDAPKAAPFPMTATQFQTRDLSAFSPSPAVIPPGSSYGSHRAVKVVDLSSEPDEEPEHSVASSSSSKRGPKSDVETDDRRKAKRRRCDPDIKQLAESLEKQSYERHASPSPPPIPSILCPFCDEPFPFRPSSYLQSLLRSLLSKSWPAPRPSNPEGRDAPLAVSINLCTTHRAESATIPAGVKRGWPRKIDFVAVRERVERSKTQKLLRAVLEDKLKSGEGRGVFWEAAKQDVERRGARAANSVQGQMETFEMTQPGYYGEKGFLVISSALQAMFPLDEIDPRMTSPLEPADFLRRVLLPETAVLLIMEDLDIDRDEALAVLRDSRAFGLAMFPVRDGEMEGYSKDNISFAASPTPAPRTTDKGRGRALGDEREQPAAKRARSPSRAAVGKGKAKAVDDVDKRLAQAVPFLAPMESSDEDDDMHRKIRDYQLELERTRANARIVVKAKAKKDGYKASRLNTLSEDDGKEVDSMVSQPSTTRVDTKGKGKPVAKPGKPSATKRGAQIQSKSRPEMTLLPPSDSGSDSDEAYLRPTVVALKNQKKKENTPPRGPSEVRRKPQGLGQKETSAAKILGDTDAHIRDSSPPMPEFKSKAKDSANHMLPSSHKNRNGADTGGHESNIPEGSQTGARPGETHKDTMQRRAAFEAQLSKQREKERKKKNEKARGTNLPAASCSRPDDSWLLSSPE